MESKYTHLTYIQRLTATPPDVQICYSNFTLRRKQSERSLPVCFNLSFALGAQTSLSIAVQTTENKKKPICFRKFGVGKLL